MNISFEGKRILVTGAGQGIGRELVLRLSKYEAEVFALSKTKKNLDSLVAADTKIHPVCVDLREWDATRKAVENILPIDLLVNNAGVACLMPFLDATPEEFDLTFDVNVKAVLNVSQVVAKNMIERKSGGNIVNISSQAGQAALKDHAVYCASKGALNMLFKTMALELGPYNIRVNAVGPTVVMTEMGKLGWSDPQKAQNMIGKIPLGRFAEIDEVVDAVVYLLSDRSSMITGVSLLVDGIGREMVLHLSKYKAEVFALSKTKKNLDSLVAADPKIHPVCVDIRDWDATWKAVENILPIDLLVNNAGVAYLTPFLDATPEEFYLTFDVNVKAVLNVSQVVSKNMFEHKSGGNIVNISSQAGQVALKDHADYCASKAALNMLFK